ncbi:actin family protein [Echinococcus multilocularis]|uniref:Actin family protein n=1 Tax=Echinococcus multilocularis TaxID=6211 RepID=A0A068YGM8_ECHMU|nr:actin family protein [Echinococcus multilocularis]
MGYGHGAWSKSGKMSTGTDGLNGTKGKYFIPSGKRIGDTAFVRGSRFIDSRLSYRGEDETVPYKLGESQFRPSGYYDSPNRTNRQRTNRRLEDGETLVRKQRSIPYYNEEIPWRYSVSVEDQNNNRNSQKPFLDNHFFRVSRLPSEPAKDQFVPKPSGHLGKYHKDVNSHENLYEKESLFKSKSHQNLSNRDEVHQKYSVPNQSISKPRPTAGLSPQSSFAPSTQELRHLANSPPKTPKSDLMPIKLSVSAERESISKASDKGERHPKGSTEEDSFFEQLTAFVKSKEKESGITHHSATKQYPGYTPSPQPEKVPPSVRTTPEAKCLAPVKKLSAPSNSITPRVAQKVGALNSSINYEEASHAKCLSADPFHHQTQDSPVRSTKGSSNITPALGQRNDVLPQAITPRLQTEPKSYQELPDAENCRSTSVIPPFESKQNDKKVIIIDMGHYYVRAGVLHNDATKPDLCLLNAIGMTSTGLLFGDAVPQITDTEGGEGLGNTSIISPLRQSQITSPITVTGVPIQKNFFQAIFQRLNLHEYGKSFKLLLCLPTRASALRPHFIDYFLGPIAEAEGFGIIESVATISAFRAALQTAKVLTCLVISLSADLEIIPLAEGGLVELGRSTVALYGEEALCFMMKEMVKWNINLSEQEIKCFGHYIYQKAAFIENKETKCHDIVVDLSQYAPCPINKRISVPAELRRKASDALLRPEQACTYDGELPPFKTLLNRAIQSCSVDLRGAICSNVLLIGEFADIEGLRERVSEEMRMLMPEGASPPTVQVAGNAAGSAYEGACLLSTVLQGPRPPRCPWFRFVDAKAWSSMRLETGCSTSFSGTRLLSRLNRDCPWP